ncbi:MAG: NifU family protein [Gammaproteobacteria bacterium]|jgi:Fe/S biogenesis protein NfuA|tara:strand:+ start:2571 stop:3158 length:588 start_codon:yes stop_codon:yes gene_type:complete
MEEMNITPSAQEYLADLLSNQEEDTSGIKIFVSEPGTPRAETCIAYAKDDEDFSDYRIIEEFKFTLYLEEKSIDFLKDAEVDYSPDKFGGTLTIKAPNAKLPQISEDASIEDKINYVLYSEINPGLASHGGEVSLIEVVNEETAILQFGGGCQGCGMVDLTLKDGVEKTLLEQVEGLKNVKDVTDHSYRENAYYK